MKLRINRKNQQIESNWSGGRTLELAICPEDAKYLDRDFIWRLSTANSDREESSFTKLPDYDRILMVLEGDVVLAHGTERSVRLQAMEQDRFDGAVKTRCFGKLIRDYNLIMDKGCTGVMKAVQLRQGAMRLPELLQEPPAADEDPDAPDASTEAGAPDAPDTGDDAAQTAAGATEAAEAEHRAWEHVRKAAREDWASFGIFCLDGYAVVNCGTDSEMVRPGEQAVLDLDPGEEADLAVMGEGRIIFTAVTFAPPADMASVFAAAGRQAAGSGAKNAASGASSDAAPGRGIDDASGANADAFGTDAGASGANAGPSGTAAGPFGADPAAASGKNSFASDYRIILGLFLQNNKWSQMLRREGRSHVYRDKILTKKLSWLEKRFVTTIVWAVGVLLCFVPAAMGAGIPLSILIAAVFSVIHLLLLGPFIYWKILPNPVRAHMKSVEEMTAMETLQHAQDIAENPRLEKLMRKYRSDGENYFTDESSPLHRLVIRPDDPEDRRK